MAEVPLIRRWAVFLRRHLWDGAALALFLAALAVGGAGLGDGAAIFLQAVTSGMAAQADQPAPAGRARLTMSDLESDDARAPQILFPVQTHILPAWLRQRLLGDLPPLRLTPPPVPARAAGPVMRRPAIAVCIDDLGEDLAGTDKAMALPPAVALSFLPYADSTPFLAAEARRRGHDILAHVPMEAMGHADPGPMALTLAGADNARRLAWNIDRVPGLIGVNNHEGSRFTADAAALTPVAEALAARHLLFFDSRTTPDSKVVTVAHLFGVTSAGRDVFLDDVPDADAIRAQLDQLAALAKRQGVAIAIGHPHDLTLKVLAEWLARDHGVDLVTLPEAVRRKTEAVALAAR